MRAIKATSATVVVGSRMHNASKSHHQIGSRDYSVSSSFLEQVDSNRR